MAYLQSQKRTGDSYRGRLWTPGKWIIFLVLFLIVWAGLYVYSHSGKGYRGYEYTGFNNEQIQHIKLVLYRDMVYPEGYMPEMERPVRRTTPPPVATDTLPADTTAATDTAIAAADTTTPVMAAAMPAEPEIDNRLICDDSCKSNKALLYIRNEFDNQLRDDQLSTIKEYISTFNAGEVGVFLGDLKLKVNSYFWLSGPFLYAELIFWTIFGVICSLIFSFTIMVRNNYYNNSNEISYQLAKFFYAPFCTIVLVLAYNYLKDKNAFDIRAAEGILVFAFLVGFFSDRIMNFLDRLKESVLPGNRQYQDQRAYAPEVVAPVAAPAYQPQYAPPAQPQQQPSPAPQKEQRQEHPRHEPEVNIYAPDSTQTETYYNEPKPQQQEEAPQVASRQQHPDNIIIKDEDTSGDMSSHMPVTYEASATGIEVRIDLKLDAGGLFEEEKKEIMQNGLGKAIVTLHSVSGRNIVPTRRIGDDRSTHFLAQNVEPGIYIARATLAQKLGSDYMINLFGEKTAYITPDRPDIELFIKRYESKT